MSRSRVEKFYRSGHRFLKMPVTKTKGRNRCPAWVTGACGELAAQVPSSQPQGESSILEEFVALTGYHRKSAVRLLRRGHRLPNLDRRGQPRQYTPDVKAALLAVWEACRRISPKRLGPFLPEIVTVLRRQIPVRTSADWDEGKPEFPEMDLVPLLGAGRASTCPRSRRWTSTPAGVSLRASPTAAKRACRRPSTGSRETFLSRFWDRSRQR